jgi:endonuclease/exonuclease/phosphatase family metal-dependent hydrolase
MKILFLNTWGGTMHDDLTHFIREHSTDTDIFCFQEAHEKTIAICDSLLANYTKVFAHKPLLNGQGFSQAIYLRKDITILSSQTLLNEYPDCGFCLYTNLQYHGEEIHLCNVHGIPHPGDKLDTTMRIRQSSDIIDSLQDKQGLKIIGGDFNLLPNTRSIRIFEENNYRNLIEEHVIDTTRNALAWKNYPTKQYYADYIFTNKDVLITDFSVLKNEISDHLPMIITCVITHQ